MQIAAATQPELPHLRPQYLVDVKNDYCSKITEEQYKGLLERIEAEVDTVTRSMLNANDHGYVFLRLVIHPGSTQESISLICEKVKKQTPWKYKPTAESFAEAIEELYRYATKNQSIIEKLNIPGDNTAILEALSALTIMYIARLVNQEKTSLAS